MVQENSVKGKIFIVCGATCSGKSALAVELAKILGSEIISADSMNIYKKLDIGTAKPTQEEEQGVTHRMIDIVDADSQFSVAQYRELALQYIDGQIQQGKIPVVCGGTGFYIDAILYNFSYGNAVGNAEIRKKYSDILEEKGNFYLFSLLNQVDPATAEKLNVNDTKRVIRALEIFETTGKRKSEQNDKAIPRYDYTAVCIDYPRSQLYARIDKRVDIMLENGLIGEVESLIADGITPQCQCMQGIGYKEVYSGLIEHQTLSQIAETIKINTRHYAKRQDTFFKRLTNLNRLTPSMPKKLAEETVNISKWKI